VINADSSDFIKSVEEWVPLAGSLEAIARLCEANYEIFVVTNQSGIGRGLLSELTLSEIHDHMKTELRKVGGRLAGIYYCPHLPSDDCPCRKPQTGLIERACADHSLEATGAPLVGDRMSDLKAARAAGCRPIFVRNGRPVPRELDEAEWSSIEVCADLAEAVEMFLSGQCKVGEGES
jgi:D-glycero-D-manno-heptose 1,7-bisphosphate phosphatase